jgi:hypothetical protein
VKIVGVAIVALAVTAQAAPREQVVLTGFEVIGREANAPLKARLRASLVTGLGPAGYEVLEKPPAGKRVKQLHVKVELVGSSNFSMAVELRDPDGKPLARVSDTCQVCTLNEAAEAVQGTPALLRMKRAEPVGADAAATAKAKELYRKGELAFQIGNFNEAAQRFQESYAEAPVPKLLWNIAMALRRQYELDHDLAKLRRASAVLRNFRSAAGEDEDTAKVTREVNEELARAEAEQKKPATVAVTPDRPSNPETPHNPLTPAVTVDKQPPPPKKPLYKNWGLWAGVGVAAGAALIIGLGVGLSSQSHENFWLTSQMGCPAAPCQVVDLR